MSAAGKRSGRVDVGVPEWGQAGDAPRPQLVPLAFAAFLVDLAASAVAELAVRRCRDSCTPVWVLTARQAGAHARMGAHGSECGALPRETVRRLNTLTGHITPEPHPVSGSGQEAHELLPAVHRVAALCKRWLLGTHQGRVEVDHLQAYLEEFCFRFNRRHSRARGLLFYRLQQYAAAAPPLTYRQLVANPQPKAIKPSGVKGPRSRPSSLAQPPEDRPWRAAASLE